MPAQFAGGLFNCLICGIHANLTRDLTKKSVNERMITFSSELMEFFRKVSLKRDVVVSLVSMVCAALFISFMSLVTPNGIPNPTAVLIIAIVYASFQGGLRAGMISGALGWIYIIFYFSTPGTFFQYTDVNLQRVFIWGLSILSIAFMVGSLKIKLERKIAEDVENKTNIPFHALINCVKDYAIIMLDVEGRVVSWNDGATNIQQYAAEEVLGKSVSMFSPIEEITFAHNDLKLAYQNGRHEAERLLRRKDGTCIWATVTNTPVFDNEGIHIGYARVVRDITERKRSLEEARKLNDSLEQRVQARTEELQEANSKLNSIVDELRISQEQLRLLSRRLHSIQEQERKRIARDIHDDLGQMLAVIKTDLFRMREAYKNTEDLCERVNQLMERVDQTIASLRQISSELRPTILENLGLNAALEWMVNDVRKRTGIDAFLMYEIDEGVLSSEAVTAIFRIVQESITNALRHAKTPRIDVFLKESHDNCCVVIRDYGVGISQGGVPATSSLGLVGMSERALSLGGSFRIEKREDKGTEVIVEVPLIKEMTA